MFTALPTHSIYCFTTVLHVHVHVRYRSCTQFAYQAPTLFSCVLKKLGSRDYNWLLKPYG